MIKNKSPTTKLKKKIITLKVKQEAIRRTFGNGFIISFDIERALNRQADYYFGKDKWFTKIFDVKSENGYYLFLKIILTP